MLEAMTHEQCCFVTLTYDDEHLPEGGNLNHGDVQLWLKRLRESVPEKLRYYLAGEYGDNTLRPHYHVALYGIGIDGSDIINRSWGLGFVTVGDLNVRSASYVVGYVTKKFLSGKDKKWEKLGLKKEYQRMSLRPGIGAYAMTKVASVIKGLPQPQKQQLQTGYQGDVPTALKQGGSSLMLGRYLRGRLRHEMGLPKDTPAESIQKAALSLQVEAATWTGKRPWAVDRYMRDQQKCLQIEKKTKIFDGGKKL